jgi:LytS/YehU family sensor histidine kinase
MERFRETAIVLLMLFLLAGTLVIIYSLVMLQEFPKTLAMIMLFALVPLKSCITGLRKKQPVQEFTCADTRLLKFILLSVFSVFLIVVYISCLLKSWQIIAVLAFALSIFTIKKAVDLLPAD